MTQNFLKKIDSSRGFTLIEMVVSTSIFVIVMVVAAGATLSIVNANRKSQSAKVAIDNLSFALENMSRHIRVGTSYSCSVNPTDKTNDPYLNVSGAGCSTFSFKFKDPALPITTPAYIIAYRLTGTVLEVGGDQNANGAIEASEYSSLTSGEIQLTNLKFYVVGAKNNDGDHAQPHVIIVMNGLAEAQNQAYATEFSLQTSITQRALDFEL